MVWEAGSWDDAFIDQDSRDHCFANVKIPCCGCDVVVVRVLGIEEIEQLVERAQEALREGTLEFLAGGVGVCERPEAVMACPKGVSEGAAKFESSGVGPSCLQPDGLLPRGVLVA